MKNKKKKFENISTKKYFYLLECESFKDFFIAYSKH